MSVPPPIQSVSPTMNKRSSKFNSEFIETDPEKILAQLSKDIIFENKFDEKIKKNTIIYTLPEWLKRDYPKETVLEFINIITPIVQEEISKSDNVEPIPQESYITGL